MELPVALGPLGLIALALVDATSIGTLVIPLMLLLTGRDGARRVAARTALYLLTIGAFYAVLGIALLAGLLPLFAALRHALETPVVLAALVALGAAMLWWSFRIDPAAIRKRGGDPEEGARRWLERVRRAGSDPRRLMALAVLAGMIEAASMVPYLAAMGMIARAGLSLPQGALVLLGYCTVMIAPGLVLAAMRALAGERADRLLRRLEGWAVRQASGAFAWAIGIIGVIIAVRSLNPLLAALQG